MPWSGWTEPLARGLDLASWESAEVQRRILATKPSLRRVYEHVYTKMLATARAFVPDAEVLVELGSGGGFLGEMAPDVVTSDVRQVRGLGLLADAQAVPFGTASVDVVFAMHVLHHIPRVRRFLGELERVLRPGGALVGVEPYWSPVAKLVFTSMHPERFDEHADAWEFPSSGPLSSNQALTYLVFQRDREAFQREFPMLELIEVRPFAGPSYLLTGGLWKRKLLPDAWLGRLWDLEDTHEFWRRTLALHHLFVLRRTMVAFSKPPTAAGQEDRGQHAEGQVG